MNNWIPVTTRLPEKELSVLVSLKSERGRTYITTACHIPEKTVLEEDFMHEDFHEDGIYDEEKDCYWTNSGWYEQQTSPEVNWKLSDKVTHWMPLPEPPKEE